MCDCYDYDLFNDSGRSIKMSQDRENIENEVWDLGYWKKQVMKCRVQFELHPDEKNAMLLMCSEIMLEDIEEKVFN